MFSFPFLSSHCSLLSFLETCSASTEFCGEQAALKPKDLLCLCFQNAEIKDKPPHVRLHFSTLAKTLHASVQGAPSAPRIGCGLNSDLCSDILLIPSLCPTRPGGSVLPSSPSTPLRYSGFSLPRAMEGREPQELTLHEDWPSSPIPLPTPSALRAASLCGKLQGRQPTQ